MSWLDKQVSLYKCPADNEGRAATLRDILFCEFGVDHDWYYKDHKLNKWIGGVFNDLETIQDLRTRAMTKEEKVILKNTLQCFTPAALLKTKKRGQVEEIGRTGLMQIDFDYASIQDYEIEELKQAVFDLPFVAFCGLSCSGNGFYALAEIAEPDKLTEYAEHCFDVFIRYGIQPDTTKGRNIHDLRFVSYDSRMLIREEPKPLQIKQFRTKKKPIQTISTVKIEASNKVISTGLNQIKDTIEGNRWQTIQRVAYTFGGLQDDTLLDQIKSIIYSSSQFAGLEAKYCQCAVDCFSAGKLNPLNN